MLLLFFPLDCSVVVGVSIVYNFAEYLEESIENSSNVRYYGLECTCVGYHSTTSDNGLGMFAPN